ncbi:membrane protein [Staphylococcus aureus]|uniref:Membrane protein n=5 Tax=Bacteria TaxID=2 RepID=A0A380DPJ3_STAAU|nr:membrane protein [Staphylococcus aureus]
MQQFKWINILKGFAMGTSDLVPGVSGGTIALLLGIYNQFIASISGIFSRRFWPSFTFLIPIIIGILLAMGSLSNLFNYLLSQHHIPTMFFFGGLIIGIVPYLLKISNYKTSFTTKHYMMVIAGIAILIVITLMNNGDKHAGETLTLSTGLIIKYFIAGMCASSAMLLPGISGSFMLLVFGVYGTVMLAISEVVKLNFAGLPILLAVGFGVLAGFIISSKIIQYFLTHHKLMTFALIIGFVVGSLFAVFPGLPTNIMMWFVSLVVFIIGFIVSLTLGRITAEMNNHFRGDKIYSVSR